MQARSALFDLYGDHLRQRGGRAPIAALIRLLGPLGIAAPAVRTAVSRMVRQGWLAPVRLPSGAGYQLTPRAMRRLDEAATRIYRTGRGGWDGRFDLIVVAPPDPAALGRAERDRLAADLAFLGYGRLDAAVWIAARPAGEADQLLLDAGVRFDRFSAAYTGGDAAAMIARAWNISAVGAAYAGFVAQLAPIVGSVTRLTDDRTAYAARCALVHAWRAFLFRDPQLPASVLPPDWPGTAAAAFFDRHAARLRPAADRFVDHCLREN
ncbi:PaaX family transcriptional regulator C-terminal domain-containing protein [Catellatospora sp. KI3]|uniref:PaaX family transcriptional regulator n=1 Tax=Catellatospora sp. KI3 TaxID=3041620 RepID=UPI002482FC52|nr:PaaX family transcriptional regulator C-terminal domain-containing protein [Catellatospora sp. KI3]MDI1460163.1 PaaX family transcriptional regulator C-terminal domain-containing protein [Catellatospora sp. KI3]